MTEREMVRDLVSRGYPLLTIAREIEVDYYRLRRWLMSAPAKWTNQNCVPFSHFTGG